ncbi:MAG TPA: heme o synthase [Thermoplasmata archaeon]|nr:heme o synthase [Thermoplasmata archaeon]
MGLTSRLADYVELSKPAITALIVAVALAGYFVARSGPVDLTALLLLLGLGALASAGAAMLNHYLDRDLDERMRRTRARPIPERRIAEPGHVLAIGVGLSVLSIGLASWLLNPLTGLSILLGTLSYVVVYTIWLKRRSSWNIVIGGFAGSAPALAGSAAAVGHWTEGALALALLLFLWTPPHFWSLALLLREDYARVGLPMLPRMEDPAYSAKVVVVSAAALVPASALLVLTAPLLPVVAIAVVGLALLFTALTAPLWRTPERRWARVGFIFSGPYLLAVILLLVANGLWLHPGLRLGS